MSVQTMPAASGALPRLNERSPLGSAGAARKDVVGLLERAARECGDIAALRFAYRPVVFVNTPEMVHTVLVERAAEYSKGDLLLRVFRRLFGNGLTVNQGEWHRRQREMMAPIFTPRAVARWADLMVTLTDRAQESWADGAAINVHESMGRLTMEIAGLALFGTPFADGDALRAAVAALGDWGMYTMTSPFAPPLGVPTPLNRRARKALDEVHRQLGGMVAGRSADGDGDEILACLLRARDRDGQPMSRSQIYDHMRTLFAGSIESTTDALTWTFYLLDRHPDVQVRLQTEADALDGRLPTSADLPKLPYALQVYKEALRLYPPASVLTRATRVDTEIGGYPVRKGTLVLISPYLLHRRADVFPEPERFDPERFTPENERRLPRGAYVPFGAGIRGCIGNHFALMEGQLVLTALTQKVRLELLPEQPVIPELKINLRPRGGLVARVRRRH